jgi:hypothetical protein
MDPCPFVGPGGFNCTGCPVGIFNTALVLCHHCGHGHSFLGDSCVFCQQPLWGRHVLPDSLPSKLLVDYVEDDPSCIDIIARNPARSSYVLHDSIYYPYASINWAPSPGFASISSDDDTFFDAIEPSALFDNAVAPCGEVNEFSMDLSHGDPSSSGCGGVLGADSCDASWNGDGSPLLGVNNCDASWDGGSMWCGVLLHFLCSWAFSLWPALSSMVHAILASAFAFQTSFWSTCFFASTLLWDAVDAFRSSSVPSVPRRHHRRRIPLVSFYPCHWMLLSSYMLLSGFRLQSPFTPTFLPIITTHARCQEIAGMVHMSPLTLWDLQKLRLSQLLGLSIQETNNSPLPETSNCPKSTPPFVPTCDAEGDIYYDAVQEISSFDWLHLDSLIDEHTINCSEPCPEFQPVSRPGLNAALGGVNFLDCLGPSHHNKFPVIFDSGASMIAISGHKGDFVGPILPPANELRLGGMACGAKVEGIGNVHWRF